MAVQFTPSEKDQIQKYFDKPLNGLDQDTFKKNRNQLRAKYHPDKFEKYEDETVREMMHERFRELESLFKKMEQYFEEGIVEQETINGGANEPFLRPEAQYGFDAMKIEIRSSDKEMKYHLFGSQLTWLERGEKYKIPGTGAYIIIESDHHGRAIGFMETVKIYLTFTAKDSLESIIEWFYSKLNNRASSLIIEGNHIPIDKTAMTQFIKRTSFLQISA